MNITYLRVDMPTYIYLHTCTCFKIIVYGWFFSDMATCLIFALWINILNYANPFEIVGFNDSPMQRRRRNSMEYISYLRLHMWQIDRFHSHKSGNIHKTKDGQILPQTCESLMISMNTTDTKRWLCLTESILQGARPCLPNQFWDMWWSQCFHLYHKF